MIIYSLQLDTNKFIKLSNVTQNEALVQMQSPDCKSRKSKCKIKEYNGKKYITCLGHRYYLDKFTKIVL